MSVFESEVQEFPIKRIETFTLTDITLADLIERINRNHQSSTLITILSPDRNNRNYVAIIQKEIYVN